jgi:O-antigen/teichoic acid export membrane protein
MIAGSLIVIIVSYFIRDILVFPLPGGNAIINDPSYRPGIGIIPLILLSYLFYGIYVIFTPGFYIRNKSHYMILFTGCGALVNILANLWLLPLFNSFWGAAWATVISYFAMTLSILLVAQRIYPIPVEWMRVFQMSVLLVMTLLIYYVYEPGLWLRTLIVFVVLGYVLLVILDKRERQMLLRRPR